MFIAYGYLGDFELRRSGMLIYMPLLRSSATSSFNFPIDMSLLPELKTRIYLSLCLPNTYVFKTLQERN